MRRSPPPALIFLLTVLAGCRADGGPGTAAAAAPAPMASAATVSSSQTPAAAAPEAAPEAAPAKPASMTLNQAILDTLKDYARSANHPYAWSRGVNTDGVTADLFWRGTLLAAPEADGGIHCSGITYEVYVHALQMVVGDGPGPSAETLLALKDPWYVRTDSDQGPVGALVDANLGDRVAGLAALQPGDLVQFWRNNGKGHSVVFINHTRNSDGSLHGMVYWSAQGTSGGIGMRRSSPGSDINQINRLYGVRARWP